MKLEEFEALVAAFGADPDRWPEARREKAIEFLSTSSDALAIQKDFAIIDNALSNFRVASPGKEVSRRILSDFDTIVGIGPTPSGSRTFFSGVVSAFMDALHDFFPTAQPWQAGALSASVMMLGIILGALVQEDTSSQEELLMALSSDVAGWEVSFENETDVQNGGDI